MPGHTQPVLCILSWDLPSLGMEWAIVKGNDEISVRDYNMKILENSPTICLRLFSICAGMFYFYKNAIRAEILAWARSGPDMANLKSK